MFIILFNCRSEDIREVFIQGARATARRKFRGRADDRVGEFVPDHVQRLAEIPETSPAGTEGEGLPWADPGRIFSQFQKIEGSECSLHIDGGDDGGAFTIEAEAVENLLIEVPDFFEGGIRFLGFLRNFENAQTPAFSVVKDFDSFVDRVWDQDSHRSIINIYGSGFSCRV